MTLIFVFVLSLSKTLFLLFSTVTGCVPLHQNSVLCCLTCASGLRRAHDQGMVVSGCNRAKMAQQYFVVRTVKRQNRPRRFYSFAEIRRDQCTPVVRLSGEPPRSPNQSSAPPVMDYNRLMPHEAKESTH